MILIVREKEFDIKLVNNFVHEQYTKMVEESGELQCVPDSIAEAEEEYKEKIETVDKEQQKALKKEYRDKVKAINSRVSVLVKNLIDTRQDIIKELLESNDYEYDVQWWLRKTDTEDCNDFMNACIKKDFDFSQSNVKKKKLFLKETG